MRHKTYRSPKAGRYGGQPPTHRDPIARLLPWFKPAVTRNRTKYSRKGRAAQQLRQALRCSRRPLSDTPALTPLSTVTPGAAIGIVGTPSREGSARQASIVNRRLLHGAKRAPCAFTETAVKRAIRAVRAAGETPGRLVVTKDGFAIELGKPGPERSAAPPPDDLEEDDLWAKKLLGGTAPVGLD